MNSVFVWTFGDVAALVLLGLLVAGYLAFLLWEAIKHGWTKIRNLFSR